MTIRNETLLVEFVLKGFNGSPTLHILTFVALLLVYVFSLFGNFLIIIIICSIHQLHSPMYFFLVCLSILETCGVSTVVPKLLDILIAQKTTISHSKCFTQGFFYFFFFSSVFLILGVMSFDRYLAICQPLRYTAILQNKVCAQLVLGCVIISCMCILVPTIITSSMPVCGHVVDHFFCDSAAVLKLICEDISLIKLSAIITSIFILVGPLTITSISYIVIIYTVMKIPSDTGRQKTVSTCVSHFTVVSIVFGSAIFIHIRPQRHNLVETDKVLNLISTIVGPLANPFIYTLRNQKVKDCIKYATRRYRMLMQ